MSEGNSTRQHLKSIDYKVPQLISEMSRKNDLSAHSTRFEIYQSPHCVNWVLTVHFLNIFSLEVEAQIHHHCVDIKRQ